MSRTAILVDGGFYRKRAKFLWGEHPPRESADALITYCRRHLREYSHIHELYRIFYYDCPPVDKQLFHPLKGKTINLATSKDSIWMAQFLECLREKRKVALRLGQIDIGNAVYTMKYEAVKKICSGALTRDTLEEKHFEPTIKQKGVDMKVGIDIASLAYKHQVDQLVLVAGDSDFVPAAKLARREGLDFILDPLEMEISNSSDLFEHIDGKRSCGNPYIKRDKPTDDQITSRSQASPSLTH